MNSESFQAFVRDLPQLVPESWCRSCRICCRFPDTEGVQTPTWSRQEVRWAVQGGARKSWFRSSARSPSRLPVLQRQGEGLCRCPAFEPEANRCTVYEVRPLDCRLYPFVLARDPAGTRTVLAMDTKCPYLQAHGLDRNTLAYAARLADRLESPEGLAYLRANPELAGPFWPEFVSVASLPGWTEGGRPPPTAPHPGLKPLRETDYPLLEAALRARPHAHSLYSSAALLGWQDLMKLWWVCLRGVFCLFAEQAGGLWMPVPPLSARPIPAVMKAAWEILRQANAGSGVSRVEGIEPPEVPAWLALGFKIRDGHHTDYLYRRREWAELRGERYKSRRWEANRAETGRALRLREFRQEDLPEALQLYTRWGVERQMRASEFYPKALIRDGLFFHRRLMLLRSALSLRGFVVEEDGRLLGYSIGAPVSGKVFCVLAEIADPAVPGLSRWLSREVARALAPLSWINGMGGDGLAGLERSKRLDRPAGVVRGVTALMRKG